MLAVLAYSVFRGYFDMSQTYDATKTERLQARVNPETKSLIEKAALLRGVSVSDFIINSAYDAASETISSHEVLHLNKRDSELFFEAITNPPEANSAFKKAAKNYLDLVN